MKTFLLMCICSLGLATGMFAQSPTASPATGGSPVTASPSATASPESDLEKSIRNKHKRHFKVTVGDHDIVDEDLGDKSTDHNHDPDIPEFVLPIVAISLMAVFGTPILIVGLIMYFGFSKTRATHRTIRMMVEKGQPVPPELLAPPPPAVRQRSDMRRGVVLMMVGAGLIVFLGAVNEWENGVWS